MCCRLPRTHVEPQVCGTEHGRWRMMKKEEKKKKEIGDDWILKMEMENEKEKKMRKKKT